MNDYAVCSDVTVDTCKLNYVVQVLGIEIRFTG